jgi:methyl-accepting chemotaxis protein
MLRRKLLFNFGPLVLMLLVAAVGAIWLMELVLADFEHHVALEGGPVPQHVISLRWLVLSLALVFVLVINIAVAVLLRMAAMIVRPVEALVRATRELARGNFDCRVQVSANDEFDELAESYNTLAEKLQASEQRKIEMLHQVALAMNHDLNNAASIIELQLKVMGRNAAGNPSAERSLRQIHESLARMTGTVQSLKNARRIVLTDYVSGVKMLDVEQSARQEDEVAHAAGSHA